jgi:hypothetical protein
MASSYHLAPSVVGGEVWTLDRIREEAVLANARQQWHLNNNVLQFARWRYEDHIGCPTVQEVMIDMKESTLEVIDCEHGKGEFYTFQEDGPTHPWSWRALVNAMQPRDAEMVVGPGLVAISLYRRPDTYDHRRANAAKTHGHENLQHCDGRPPIWDFRFYRSDGISMTVHPHRQKNTKMDIAGLKYCPNELVMPKAGSGKSDGKGTYPIRSTVMWPQPAMPPWSSSVPPSPPGAPTGIQVGPPSPPPRPPCPHVPIAPPVVPEPDHDTVLMRFLLESIRADCITAQAAIGRARPYMPELQDGRRVGFQALMAAAKSGWPAAPFAICHGQAAHPGCGVALGGKAAVPTPKALATPAKAAVLTSNAAQPDTGSPWIHWRGKWVKNEHGEWR